MGPLTETFRISFLTQYPPRPNAPGEFTLANYGEFFSSSIYYIPLVRTLVFAAANTLFTLIVVFPIAYYLARHAPRHRRFYLLILAMVPLWASDLARSYAVVIFLGNRGALNSLLIWMGVISEPIPMLYTNLSLGIGMLYFTALFMLLPLYNSLENLPRNVIEAAADLGARPFTRLWRITVPLARDGIATGCSLVFLISVGAYAVPLLLAGSNGTLFGQTIASYFYQANAQWPRGAAFAVIQLVAALAIAGLFHLLVARRPRKGA